MAFHCLEPEESMHWECPGLVSWPIFLIGPQFLHLKPKKGFPGGSVVKNHLLRQETWIRSLGQEDPLEKEWQPTPVFLPGESPWTEEAGGLYSPWGLKRVEHDLVAKQQQQA